MMLQDRNGCLLSGVAVRSMANLSAESTGAARRVTDVPSSRRLISASESNLPSSFVPRALRAKGLGSSRAGLVKAFGWSPSSGGDGIPVAKAANLAVAKNLPLFSKAYQQNFWTSGADGTVTLKVFFFARSD
jgi:hypothetical protein